MRRDIREIAESLDEVIEKGNLEAEDELVSEPIKKSLSFNPATPHYMTVESPYYNPYRQLPDGTYAPHPPSYWTTQGRYDGDKAQFQRDGLRETANFYRMAGSPRDAAMGASFTRSMKGLSDLSNNVDEFIKALPAAKIPSGGTDKFPIGTVHTFKDGKQYRKMGPGNWVPQQEGHAAKFADPKTAPKASAEVDQHAGAVGRIQDKLQEKKKQGEQDQRIKHIINDEIDRRVKEGGPTALGHEADAELAVAEGEVDDKGSKLKQNPMDGPDNDQEAVSGKMEEDNKVVALLDRLAKMAKTSKDGVDQDLCKVSVPGTNLFCEGNLGIPRQEMPQLKGNPVSGSEADKLPKDENGEVNAEDLFAKELKESGVKLTEKQVPAEHLRATQSQLVGAKVAGMTETLKKDPYHPKLRAPIYISKDGYVLDGHHRWAAHVGLRMASGDDSVKMDVIEVDMDVPALVKFANDFADKVGIAQKAAKVAKAHKYIKREGSSGNFKYTYPDDMPSGKKQSQTLAAKITRTISDKELKQADKELFDEDFAGKLDPAISNNIKDGRFKMRGAMLTVEDVADFVKEFEKDFQMTTPMGNQLKKAGATHFSTRLKDEKSLHKKMTTRLQEWSLNSVYDVIGARGLTDDFQKQSQMFNKMMQNLDVVKIEDMRHDERGTGYRAVHIIFKTPSKKLGELQLKTYRQQIWAGWNHDEIYKGPEKIKNDPAVQKYAKEISDILYKMDHGEDVSQKVPEAPKILKEVDLEFPWDEVKEFGLRDVAIHAEKGLGYKYYGVVRDEQKKNLRVVQFGTFKEAKTFKERLLREGHKGEIPLAYSKTMREFLETFSEYRTENWEVISDLQDKIGKKEPNKGGEVKLNKSEIEYLVAQGRFALISAGRHAEAMHTEEIPELSPAEEADWKKTSREIRDRYKNLEKDLKSSGLTYTRATGHFGDTEDVYLVMTHDADRQTVIDLGKKYNQNSVIYAENGRQEMHFTVGDNQGKLFIGEGVEEKDMKAENFYTSIKTSEGETYKFALNFDRNKLMEAKEALKSLVASMNLKKSDITFQWIGGDERWQINIAKSEE